MYHWMTSPDHLRSSLLVSVLFTPPFYMLFSLCHFTTPTIGDIFESGSPTGSTSLCAVFSLINFDCL